MRIERAVFGAILIIGWRIKRGAGSVEPERRRFFASGNGFADGFCGVDARINDFAFIFRVVAAIDAAAGEVDDDVGAVELARPGAGRAAIPLQAA